MPILKGQTAIAVTATAQQVTFADSEAKYTLINTGSQSVMYVHSPPHAKDRAGTPDTGVLATDFVGASVAAIQTLGGSEIPAKGAVVIGPDIPGVLMVCITGQTSTVELVVGEMVSPVLIEANIGNVGLLNKAESEIDPAEGRISNVAAASADVLSPSGLVRKDTRALPEGVANGDWVAMQGTSTGELRVRDDDANTDLAAIEVLLTAANAQGGAGLTFTSVPIATTGTAELLAKTASQTQRLHALYITMDVADTVEIQDKDGGTLAGPWNFGANGGIAIPFDPSPDGTIDANAVNKGLQIVVAGGNNCRGVAVVSTGV